MTNEVERWRKMLQAIGNAEASILAAYRASGQRGAWVDGTRPGLRPEVAALCRQAAVNHRPNPAAADGHMEVARGLAQKAIRLAEVYELREMADNLQDLMKLGYDPRAVDLWREVRITTRLSLDAATDAAGLARVPPASVQVRAGPKIGRNQPCPCGSGKKYKKCCGKP